MLKTVPFLWRNRVRPGNFRIATKVYAKRLWTFPSMLATLKRILVLEFRGATILELTTISNARIIGRLARLQIGSGTAIGECELAVFSDMKIGNHVVISDGVKILTASHDIRSETWDRIEQPIVIEDYAWIATNAIILPGVTVGRGSVIAAGAVLAKSVPPNVLVMGNPSKIVGNVRPVDLRYFPTSLIASFEAWLGPT